ncbi:MAG: AAA family ATPase [Chloroflexota bacterium]|nr:AAA family ATPase [Chloroflexota bacterium]
MKVIGVIGKNGSGKDEVLKYLRDRYGVPFLSTGDIVRGIAATEGREPTRPNLQEISDRYFRERGEGCFVRMTVDRIRENGWTAAGISGVRSPIDVKILKESLGGDFVLIDVYVTDPRMRFERMSARGEGRDAKAYDDFVQQDEAEEAMFHIDEASKMAAWSLDNDGTLEDLHRTIGGLVGEGLLG